MPTKHIPFQTIGSTTWRINVYSERFLMGGDFAFGSVVHSYNGHGHFDPSQGLYVYLVTTGVDGLISSEEPRYNLGLTDMESFSLCPRQQITDIFVEERESVDQDQFFICCPPIVFPEVSGFIRYYAVYNELQQRPILMNKIDLSVTDHKVILRGAQLGDPLRLFGAASTESKLYEGFT